MLTNPRTRDVVGGILITLIGIGATAEATRYSEGTLSRMGPGFFPTALGVILTVMGVVIALTAKFAKPGAHDKPDAPAGPEWRGWFCIALSVIAFGVVGKYLGLIPATLAIVFISALGDRDNNWKHALILSIGMIIFCVVVFSYGLQIQFPLFGHAG
jgi:hypothetical protein